MLTRKAKFEKFTAICEQMSARLIAAGVTPKHLLATLPEARDRVYARRYGKKPASSRGRVRRRVK